MSIDLYTRQRELHGVKLWWICRKIARGHYEPYSDIYAPTGYGYSSKAKADKKACELEQELEARSKA